MMNPARHGYTLTELVTASALTLVACLGGLSAVSYSAHVSLRAEASTQARTLVAALDRAAPTCNLEQALNPRAPPLTCALLRQRLAQGPVQLMGKPTQGPLTYRLEIQEAPGLQGLLLATTTLALPDATLRHVLLLSP
jgi:hypothetical protein